MALLATLRPAGVMGDDNDATYTDEVATQVGELSLSVAVDASAVVGTISHIIVYARASTHVNFQGDMELDSSAIRIISGGTTNVPNALWETQGDSNIATYNTGSLTLAPDGGAWTAAKITNGFFFIVANVVSLPGGTESGWLRGHDIWIEVHGSTEVAPTVSVTGATTYQYGLNNAGINKENIRGENPPDTDGEFLLLRLRKI